METYFNKLYLNDVLINMSKFKIGQPKFAIKYIPLILFIEVYIETYFPMNCKKVLIFSSSIFYILGPNYSCEVSFCI